MMDRIKLSAKLTTPAKTSVPNVTASDQNGVTPAVDHFDITIEAVNDLPVIVSIPDLIAWEDTEYIYQIDVQDVDNDFFYYNLGTSPDSMEVDSFGH